MDKLAEGLIVTLLGMGATFLIMAVLVFFIYLIEFLIKIFNKKQPDTVNEQIIEKCETDDKKIITAVTAAVYCYMQQQGKTESDFIVRKIRKVI
ncbi:MAG: OadG family protein [Clostridia bacterium]|nr:OadG family protein [Clostridia bacterium]